MIYDTFILNFTQADQQAELLGVFILCLPYVQ